MAQRVRDLITEKQQLLENSPHQFWEECENVDQAAMDLDEKHFSDMQLRVGVDKLPCADTIFGTGIKKNKKKYTRSARKDTK